MRLTRLRQSLVAVFVLVSFLAQGTWVLAGTTGQIGGTVLETGTTTPIVGAKVTAVSPSQSATTTTDSNGKFNFISLAPDTYTINVEKQGYDPVSTSGISVFADQRQDVSLNSARTLRVIGRVTSRANSELVRPGQTSNVYSVSASQADAVKSLGGGGALDSAYSGIASVPGVFIPISQSGWAQSVYVRGGNYTELGYEYDGVPIQRAFDQYPGGTLSSLGQQELQIYAGSSPASAQSSGLAGFVNQVIKTGTYPGFGTIDGALGSPSFYHKLLGEVGGASSNRNFSYYAAAAGYNQTYRIASQYNGADYQNTWGVPYAIVATGCGGPNPTGGCYANGSWFPNGLAYGPLATAGLGMQVDRETIANLKFGLPHKSNDLKDEIQVLFNTTYLQTTFADSMNDWGAQLANILNGTAVYNGTTYSGSAVTTVTSPANYFDHTIFTGVLGQALTAGQAGLVAPYLNPKSPPNRQFGSVVPFGDRDSYEIRAGIAKLQYQKNISDRSFLRLYGYTYYSDWMNKGYDGSATTFVGTPPLDYDLISHTSGASLQYVNQINDKMTLNFTGGYTQSNTVRWNNFSVAGPTAGGRVALLVSSAAPTNGICYKANLTPVACASSSVAAYKLPSLAALGTGSGLVPSTGAPTLATVGTMTCGGAPCEYFTTDSGLGGRYNLVKPQFTNLSLADSWHPTSKLTVDLALKYDNFNYKLDNSNVPQGPLPSPASAAARTLYTNSFNNWNCINNVLGQIVAATAPGVCPAGSVQAAYSTNSPSSNLYSAISPRIAASFAVNPFNVIKASFGRYVQPASTAFQQYDGAYANLASANANFYLNGYNNPSRYIYPEDSIGAELSWEHQFKGNDASFKITPFYRKTRGEIYNVVLDPKTNFVSGINVGNKRVFGAELMARKGNFDQNGFAAQLSYTYTFASIQYQQFPNGSTLVTPVNNSIQQYNAYTSFCAGNPNNALCANKNGPVLPTNGAAAAPCYAGAVADPTCSMAGTIANPYWNAPPQPLFNPGNNYVPFNQLPGTGLSSVSSSYVVPHVAALVLNYKHDRWTFTPTVQFSAGGQYGSPVQGVGIDPASGCAALAGRTLIGDPRYQYGATGGAPYDASSCPGSLTTPDFYTKQFDNFGAFREPSSVTMNLQVGFQASKNIQLQLTAVNLVNRCFGGTATPWNNAGSTIGCWYGTPFYTSAGNFFNPGDQFQQQAQYPYAPTVGYNASQQAYGVQSNPFQLFLEAKIRL